MAIIHIFWLYCGHLFKTFTIFISPVDIFLGYAILLWITTIFRAFYVYKSLFFPQPHTYLCHSVFNNLFINSLSY